MAFYDHAKAADDKKSKEKYEELKENLRKSKNEDDEMIWRHILKLEHKAETAKKELEEYRKFFEQLQKLTPRRPSIHDILR